MDALMWNQKLVVEAVVAVVVWFDFASFVFCFCRREVISLFDHVCFSFVFLWWSEKNATVRREGLSKENLSTKMEDANEESRLATSLTRLAYQKKCFPCEASFVCLLVWPLGRLRITIWKNHWHMMGIHNAESLSLVWASTSKIQMLTLSCVGQDFCTCNFFS